MRVAVFGSRGRVGTVLVPALEAAGYETRLREPAGCDAAVDFTTPEAVESNVERCLDQGVPVVVGTTGWDVARVDRLARERLLPVFFAPNFSTGAVLMMRIAKEAARWFPEAQIIDLHHDSKRDAPSGTAIAAATAMGNSPSIASVRLPGLVAHHEVIFGAPGERLTIRHDTTSREAFVPGVLIALQKLHSLPPGVTVGLEHVLE